MYGAEIGDGTVGTFNLRNNLLLLFVLIVIAGCTIKTHIIEPDGNTYIIQSKNDSLVTMTKGDWNVTVDNRGKPNIFESLLGWLLLKTPNIVEVK